MTRRVRLRPEAELDLADAALWFEHNCQNWDIIFLTK